MRRKLISLGSGCLRAAALGALLLLATPWQTSASDAKPMTAILIVAQAEVTDPFFSDSVVLVLNNLGPAPVGIIINRPLDVPIARLFPNRKDLAQLPDKVYFGGPVDFGSVWFLFRAASKPTHAVQAFEGVYLSASEGLLRQLLARKNPSEGLRIFIGHAGWAPGQLQEEIKSGGWTLEHANSDGIFNPKSEHPWPAPQEPKHSI
jgi:putative transcriptional regulator